MADARLENVLQRWRATSDGRTVVVTGPAGCGRTTLADRLGESLPDHEVSERSSGSASVVVLVFDASAPIGREELDLLADARSRGPVCCVLARIDAHSNWPDVLRRDAELLAVHAPGSGRVVAVSAHTGSGVADLATAIEAATGPETDVRADIERARALVREAASSLEADRVTAQLRVRRAALVADRDRPRTAAAATLRRLAALARVDFAHRAGDGVRAVSATIRSEVDRAGRSQLAAIPARLREEATTLTLDLDAAARAQLIDLCREVLGEPLPVGGADRPPPTVADPSGRHRGGEDRVMILVGASAGVGLGKLVTAPLAEFAALDLVTLPATLVVGAGAAWWLARMRALAADRAHLRQWIADSMAQVRSALETRALTVLVEVEAQVADAMSEQHRERVRATDEELVALDRELRASVSRTSGRLAAVERDLDILDRALAEDRTEPAATALRPS